MKVDIYLVKDENTTIANFRNYPNALEYCLYSKNDSLAIERIEVELPHRNDYKEHKITKEVTTQPIKDLSEIILNKDDILENVVNNHIVNIYNQTGRNKLRTSKILGIAVKTLYNRFNKLGIL